MFQRVIQQDEGISIYHIIFELSGMDLKSVPCYRDYSSLNTFITSQPPATPSSKGNRGNPLIIQVRGLIR